MKRLFDINETIKLAGFNNLTKSLSFNLYDFCAARSVAERESYIKYVANRYNAKKISAILHGISNIIEAEVIATSNQDYEPWGASSLVLVSDVKGSGVHAGLKDKLPDYFKLRTDTSFHLDKSHICAHTYPDFHAQGTVCSIRVDIDISTCGEISPLKALNYMLTAFDSDVVVMDYVVRGFTRDEEGRRIYMDHPLRSIQDYIDPEILADYFCIDLALQSDNIWQTKMLRTKLDESTYFLDRFDPEDKTVRTILDAIKREMRGVLHMWPE